MTKHFNWQQNIKEEELDYVIEVLNNNGVVIFPTETVYGLGGNALEPSISKRIYEIKKRPMGKALNILVKNQESIKNYAVIQNDLEKQIIEKLMPGPLTIILKKKDDLFKEFTLIDTIGIRIPDNKIIQSILERIDYPLIGTSANISGKPDDLNKEELYADFDSLVDVIIYGGKPDLSKSSTILKVENNDISVLREGTLTEKEIREKLF